jgi:triacylglycerol lipase
MNPLLLAQGAERAYHKTPDIGEHTSASRAIVEKIGGNTVISFPGSDNLACWLADLNVTIRDVPGMGRVHEGFWKSWKKIADGVQAVSVRHSTILSGHSLGAALAILAGAALCLSGKPPLAVYAFEPPRVSIDSTITKLFSDNHVEVFLYRNGFDVVPMIPRILHSWQHCGTLIEIGTPSSPVPNIEDHSINRVIEALF